MQNLPVILASESPSRLEILNRLNITPYKIIPSNISESQLPRELPKNLAARLAREKCKFVASQIDIDSIVIAADTVTACGRRILPKATSKEEVRYCLNLLSGRRNKVYTGLCIAKKLSSQTIVRERLIETIVKFKLLSPEEIDFYSNLDEGLNRGGGCKISGYAEAFITAIYGSYSNVMGLPMFETLGVLNSLGYNTTKSN